MKRIFEFNTGNEKLILFKNKKTLEFGKETNGILSTKINTEEKKIILQVLKSLLPNAEIIRLRDFKFEDKKIIHWLDAKKNYHYFYERVNDHDKLLDESVQSTLNRLFNNQNEYVTSSSNSNLTQNPFFKRLIKIGKKVTTVLVSAALVISLSDNLQRENVNEEDILEVGEAIAFIEEQESVLGKTDQEIETLMEDAIDHSNLIPKSSESQQSLEEVKEDMPEKGNNPADIKLIQIEEETPEEVLDDSLVEQSENTDLLSNEETLEQTSPDVEMQEEIGTVITVEDIMALISNTPNLSDEEKELLLSSPELFKDKMCYLDRTIVDQLSNINIEYKAEKNGNILGTFSPTESITCYNTTDFSTTTKSVITHEFLHSFSNLENYTYWGSGIYERLNEMMNTEYFGQVYMANHQDEVYTWNGDYVYALCEIVEPDVLKEYHANPSPIILIDELTKINGDFEQAMELIADIDFINNYMTQVDEEEQEKLKDTYDETQMRIRNSLIDYYEKKYNSSIDENINMLWYLDKEKTVTMINDYLINQNVDGTYDDIITKTAYFNTTAQNDKVELEVVSSYVEVEALFTLEELLQIYGTEDKIPFVPNEDGLYPKYGWNAQTININLSDLNQNQEMSR